ncbi:MAG: hypothetical protein J6I49_07710 [Bacteroidales bacterium]|nr:hypothetical protein [Bacteroidales bacterium]
MKKNTYQPPSLTVVTFRSERGYQASAGQEQTFSLKALFGDSQSGGSGLGGVEQREEISSWTSSTSW